MTKIVSLFRGILDKKASTLLGTCLLEVVLEVFQNPTSYKKVFYHNCKYVWCLMIISCINCMYQNEPQDVEAYMQVSRRTIALRSEVLNWFPGLSNICCIPSNR